MKTIAQILPSLVSGGVERGTIQIAKAIKASGHRSLVLSSGGAMTQQLGAFGAEHILMQANTKNPYRIWRNIDSIRKIITKENINLLHARSRAPAWSAHAAARKAGIPFVTTFHGVYNFNSFLKKYYNSIMTKGDAVIAVSKFVKNHILENYSLGEDKIHLIYRGTDCDYFNPEQVDEARLARMRSRYKINKDQPLILMPARLSSWKGQGDLIKALGRIREKDFQCLLVGSAKNASYAQRLQLLIDELGLGSKVRIFPVEYDIKSLYYLSDIVISASREPEAFGRVVTEAQAMAKLVLATNIGGAAETIRDEVSGFHANPSDPRDLAEKISYLLKLLGSATANNISSNARASVINNFSSKLMEAKTLSLYENILDIFS